MFWICACAVTAAEEFVSLKLHAGQASSAELVGPNARLQLLLLGTRQDGTVADLTRDASFEFLPEDIVQLDRKRGRVAPLGNGEARVTAAVSGLTTSVTLRVTRFDDPPQLSFQNDIVPIFTKMGCNSGGCHGKSGGQNGFSLSLLGFEPADDYQFITKERRGRRVFSAAPDLSLLLQKATGTVPHGGGARIAKASQEYRLLKQWIAQGTPWGRNDEAQLERIEVYPRGVRMVPRAELQLRVMATYSDGQVRDVTNQAQFASNDTELADVTAGGLLRTKGRAGVVAAMVRFQGHATAATATLPLGQEVERLLPPAQTLVDEHVFAQLRALGLPPAEPASDATFLRRVTLDIAGRLPTYDESVGFLADQRPDKRAQLIERLLDSDDYATHFAQKWTAILRNRAERNEPRTGNFLFHEWVRESLAANVPFDQFVTRLLTAAGDTRTNPAVNWHLKFDKMEERSEDTAQVFLGQRIGCAKCHHHPYEKWSQEDYWRFAAFFANVAQKSNRRIYSKRGVPRARNTRDQQMVLAAGLSAEPLAGAPHRDARLELARWVTAKGNPYFARMLVNRYWKHFFGVGIVEPEDDLRSTNPPSNPELLAALEQHFIDSDYDLRELIRTLCNSSTYQLSSVPNAYNAKDSRSFSKFTPRRMPAEVLLDSIDAFLGSKSRFAGLPLGTRAIHIPDHGSANNAFLDAFGRPAGASACECERSGEVTMAQSLQLLNSEEIHQKLDSSYIETLASTSEIDLEEKIRRLHLVAFSREPLPREVEAYLKYLESPDVGTPRDAFQDIMWAMINTKEFLFNR